MHFKKQEGHHGEKGISERLPQANRGTQDAEIGEPGLQQSRLRSRIEAASRYAQSGEGDRESYGDVNRTIEGNAKELGLWLPITELDKLGTPFVSGSENDNYIDEDRHTIYKVNNLVNNGGSMEKLFQNIDLFNQYFPSAKLEFVGVTGFGNGNAVYPIYSQLFIPNARFASDEEIADYMYALGFRLIGEAKYTNGNVTISDLHPRNVLKDADGDIYVIDAELH
jgi:hypothetical protein